MCKSRYGYYQLNADEKAVYDQLVMRQSTLNKALICPSVTREQIQKESATFFMVDLYYLTDEYELSRTEDTVKTIYLTYSYNSDTVNRINAEVDKKLNEILGMITPKCQPLTK